MSRTPTARTAPAARRTTAAPSQPESNGHAADSPLSNGIHHPSTNGTAMTGTATPPTVTGTPVAPTTPTATVLPETNNGTGGIVSELGRIVQQAKDRLQSIQNERTEAQKKADAEKAKIDQDAEAERLRLEKEEQTLREQLAGVGVTFNAAPAPAARRIPMVPVTAGKIGRPKGSKNKTNKKKAVAAPAAASTTAAKKPGGKKKRNTGGMTAPELTLALIYDADGPVPLAEIRRHLRANGKMSNASVVTDGMVNKGQLKKTTNGFLIGKTAAAEASV